jgi:predicted dehydrogenase
MTVPKKLNWGILGAARVNERLLPAIMTAANAQLVAIASRRPGAAAATLAKYAVGDSQHVNCYDDLASLIMTPRWKRFIALWPTKSMRIGPCKPLPRASIV